MSDSPTVATLYRETWHQAVFASKRPRKGEIPTHPAHHEETIVTTLVRHDAIRIRLDSGDVFSLSVEHGMLVINAVRTVQRGTAILAVLPRSSNVVHLRAEELT